MTTLGSAQTAPIDNPRQARGLALAKSKAKAFRPIAGNSYLVPSATTAGNSGYVVDLVAGTCTCPDFETSGVACKHQWALRYLTQEQELPDGSVVTEVRQTYSQNWPAYNRAQCEEKERVQILLKGLCDGIQQPSQGLGRPRTPLADVVYGAALKVYGTMSGRRSTTDLRECEAKGFVDHAASYNTLFRYVESPALLPLLTLLVEESAAPLRAIEQHFAVDGTGFSTNTYSRWFDHKYGKETRVKIWIKAHAMIGVKTNIVTAVRVTEGNVNDSPQLVPLLASTVANDFNVAELSADKAYLSNDNLMAIESVGAAPYIPFKSNSQPTGESEAWRRLYHLFELHREVFLEHYHRRSNVESTFSAIKRKFGGSVRSKLPAAQFNEVLLKCLCHNLSTLVHSIHELGIEPRFWLPRANGGAR
ncbi:MAG: transposase [Myxococcales bacterium]|nr:transposase [Myxococcales bacterium]